MLYVFALCDAADVKPIIMNYNPIQPIPAAASHGRFLQYTGTCHVGIFHIVTCMRFPWFNNVSSATTMEQYNTCVSLVTQTILGD
jgi:hypothetical protein